MILIVVGTEIACVGWEEWDEGSHDTNLNSQFCNQVICLFGAGNQQVDEWVNCGGLQLIEKTWNPDFWYFPFVKIVWEMIPISRFSVSGARTKTVFSCLRWEIVGTKPLLPLQNPIWGFWSEQKGSWCLRPRNQESNAQEFRKGISPQEFWNLEKSYRIRPKSPGRIF